MVGCYPVHRRRVRGLEVPKVNFANRPRKVRRGDGLRREEAYPADALRLAAGAADWNNPATPWAPHPVAVSFSP